MGDSRGRWEGDNAAWTSPTSTTRRGSTTPATSTAKSCASSNATRCSTPIRCATRSPVTDPKVFTRPWTMTMSMYRQKEMDRVLEYHCRGRGRGRPTARSSAIPRTLDPKPARSTETAMWTAKRGTSVAAAFLGHGCTLAAIVARCRCSRRTPDRRLRRPGVRAGKPAGAVVGRPSGRSGGRGSRGTSGGISCPPHAGRQAGPERCVPGQRSRLEPGLEPHEAVPNTPGGRGLIIDPAGRQAALPAVGPRRNDARGKPETRLRRPDGALLSRRACRGSF